MDHRPAPGRHLERPRIVDPVGSAGLRRRWERFRLKEWIGFLVVHPEVWVSMIVQDAKVVTTGEVLVLEPSTGTKAQHELVAPGSAALMPPELWGRRAGIVRDRFHLTFGFDEPGGTHDIVIDVDASDDAPAISARLRLLDGRSSAPLSVLAPLPGGELYTWKQIFPVEGTVTIDDRTYAFDPARDLAIVDEHRSRLPYRTRWTWGTFGARTDAGIVGANFATRPMTPGSEDESCLWGPGIVEPLDRVSFTRTRPSDDLAPWTMRSADGRLDVTFHPIDRHAICRRLGVFAIDYWMLRGTYEGTITTAAGTHEVEGVHGVCEEMDARL